MFRPTEKILQPAEVQTIAKNALLETFLPILEPICVGIKSKKRATPHV